MPTLISRAEALARIRAEGGEPACIMCAIARGEVGETHAIFEDEAMLVFLPRYVRCWGHACIMPKLHGTSYATARCVFSASPICKPTVKQGLIEEIGSW